jgi:hypothetical protein
MTRPEDAVPSAGRSGADSADVERYLAQVRAALDDLPAQQRDDLLEDLPGHLLEASADSGRPSSARSGHRTTTPPTCGPPPACRRGPPADGRRGGPCRPAHGLLEATSRRVGELADRVARRGRAARARLPAQLRPAWWVLRGYLVLAVPPPSASCSGSVSRPS